jgi:hypothetical protein
MGDTKRYRNLKTITIGSSKSYKVNDVGSPHLHKHNKIGLTQVNKTTARAIVYDQHVIDRLYLEDYINEQQHAVCDKYLGVIGKSGAFVSSSSSSLDKIFTGQYSDTPPRSVLLSSVQKLLYNRCGREIEKEFWKIMCNNPKKVTEKEIAIVIISSKALQDFWFIGLQTPVTLFQQALTNPL